MKKLFLPLALLSLYSLYALESSAPADQGAPVLTAEEAAAQQAMLQAAGASLQTKMLENPQLAAWYSQASVEDAMKFDECCVRYATINLVVYSQFAPLYAALFNELTALTDSGDWSVQINFIAQELTQMFQQAPSTDYTAAQE